MGRILFHAIDEDIEISGCERARFSHMGGEALMEALRPVMNGSLGGKAEIRRLLPPDCYVLRSPMPFDESLRLYLTVGLMDDGTLLVEDRKLKGFTLLLNTGLAKGDDAFKLAMRLHGQCEIYTWVDGKNRAWLADIVQSGIGTNLYQDERWNDVVRLLRKSDDSPVVTSYSVCQSFPNPDIAEWKDENDGDDFYNLSDAEQWDLAMKPLLVEAKQEGITSREIKPENWQGFRFGNGWSGFDVVDWLQNNPAEGATE